MRQDIVALGIFVFTLSLPPVPTAFYLLYASEFGWSLIGIGLVLGFMIAFIGFNLPPRTPKEKPPTS